MRTFWLLFVCSFLLISCGSSKRSFSDNNVSLEKVGKKRTNVVENALKFEGTPYKYGGTTKSGMDCSGLIYVAFQKENIPLPRTSRAMSLEGERLKMREVSPGDLLFFQTNKNRNVINHVGLVISVSDGEIAFVHSSTSRGVIVSSLSQAYWNEAFMMARRVIDEP
ncbi:MAG TPA: C40 family peptidase [Flavobacteriaceae bacterium]|nr:C40 family peptidase [Flavobacteriaceae bacterium]